MCNEKRPADLHHILKRVSSSPFNATPVCRVCHDNILFDKKTTLKLLASTFVWLTCCDHTMTNKDSKFLNGNKDLIEEMFEKLHTENDFLPKWIKLR